MGQRTCTEDGCLNPHIARGLCGKHYQRWRKASPDAELRRQHRPPVVCGPVARVPLTKGQEALVDAADAALVGERTWSTSRRSDGVGFYALDPYGEAMHRVIMGLAREDPTQVDHLNGNGIDNRRSNLRPATPSQNAANRKKPAAGANPYKGVSWHKRSQTWYASIRHQGRSYHLGQFRSPEDAARAYDKAALELSGEFALINLPPGEVEA